MAATSRATPDTIARISSAPRCITPHNTSHTATAPRGLGYQRSEGEILTEDDHVDATHVEVAVHSGEVMLSGTVEDRVGDRANEPGRSGSDHAHELFEHVWR